MKRLLQHFKGKRKHEKIIKEIDLGMNDFRRAVLSCLELMESQRKAMFQTTRKMISLRKKILGKVGDNGDAGGAGRLQVPASVVSGHSRASNSASPMSSKYSQLQYARMSKVVDAFKMTPIKSPLKNRQLSNTQDKLELIRKNNV